MPTSPSFFSLGVDDAMIRALDRAGIQKPFPIQAATLEAALAGKDLCGRAPTGSGKTLAFAIPAAMLADRAESKRPRALILTPTRELAGQIRDAIVPLAQTRSRRVTTTYGGTNINRDIKRLRDGVDIVVATPGRLEDLIRRRCVSLEDVNLVVLDEADRMADMGFLPVVKTLLDMTSPERQTLLFSATLDGDVDVLVRRYQQDPVTVEIDEPVHAAGEVRHLFWSVDRTDRKSVTADVVRDLSPAIVFTRTKRGADRLTKQLRTAGIDADAIHGDRSQNQRERALKRFKNGTSKALVATDVAARGIHVDDVAVVVHYDPPGTDKDYVHRSGRTGRAGSTGVVVSLVHDEVAKAVDALQRDLSLPREVHRMDLASMTSGDAPVASGPTDTRPAGKPRSSGDGSSGGQGSGARKNRNRKRSGKPSGNRQSNGNRNSNSGRNENADRNSNGSRNSSDDGSRSNGGNRNNSGARNGGNRKHGGQRATTGAGDSNGGNRKRRRR